MPNVIWTKLQLYSVLSSTKRCHHNGSWKTERHQSVNKKNLQRNSAQYHSIVYSTSKASGKAHILNGILNGIFNDRKQTFKILQVILNGHSKSAIQNFFCCKSGIFNDKIVLKM